jgi:hypothetical protein
MATPQRWGLAEIEWSQNGVRLYCSEPGVITALLEELKQYIPHKIGTTRKTIAGEVDTYLLDNLKSQNQDAGRWFVMRLCQQGWEPLAESGLVQPLAGWAQFRKVLQE